MKLCVSSTGKELKSKVDTAFGRAHYLLIVDIDSLEMEVVDNSGVNIAQGAGIAATELIVAKGAEALLTGHVGPKAYTALKSAGLNIYEGVSPNDTIEEAVKRFKEGKVKESSRNIEDAIYGPGLGRCRGGGRSRGRGMGRGMGPAQGRERSR